MKEVSHSILYFRVGHIVFEKAWMEKIASLNKKMKVVDTSRGVSLITGAEPCNHGDEEHAGHDDHHGHDHGGIDPHIWLSPTAVEIQAKHIRDAFIEIDGENKTLYETNYQALIKDIRGFHQETVALLAPLKGKKFMVYHPAWSYFAREYGLMQYPIEVEGKRPGAADLKRLIDLAKKENIKVVFVQKQFDADSARAIADAIGGKVVAMDPLAPDWLKNMKKIAETFNASLMAEENAGK